MKRFSFVLIAILAVLAASLPAYSCGAAEYSRSGVVLGDAIVLRVSAKGSLAKDAVQEMFGLADEVFAGMNLSDKSSALSVFNASISTEPLEVDRHTFEVLTLAKEAHGMSSGTFDVTSLPLSKLWGVDIEGIHSHRPDPLEPYAETVSELPDYESVRDTLRHVGFDKISFYEENGNCYIRKLDPLAEVDLGGIAKGYFADLCVDIAEKNSLESCLIDISGNIYLYGRGIKSGGDWSVGISDPRPRTVIEELRGYVAAVKCAGDRSFVTSGDYQRFYYYNPSGSTDESDFIAVCHIIDPRSGLPVGIKYDGEKYVQDFSAVCSASVSGESSALCDALSTAVAVLGIDAGRDMLETSGYDGLIFTTPDGETGKGKCAAVGEWEFIDGYDGYKTSYERIEA